MKVLNAMQLKNGAKSTKHKNFILSTIKRIQPDITVAIDLFFHDFKIPRPFSSKDKKWVTQVVDNLSKSSGLLILGNALGLRGLGGAQDANALMNNLAEQYDNIIVIDVDQMYKDLHSSRGYQYNVDGKKMSIFRSQEPLIRITSKLL